jgi:hypothetical protein
MKHTRLSLLIPALYNENYLLDITFQQSGVGAYPDTQTKHFLINLRNGLVTKAVDGFNPDSLATLAEIRKG